jgi:hypothetical protein
MIRFTWMQARAQTMVAAAGLAIAAVALAITGAHLSHLYDTTVANCAAHGNCSAASAAFLENDHGLQIGLNVLVIAIPGLIGLFWGAPIVASELEGGTFRLAWTQSVTRVRWLAVKLGVIGLASAAAAGLLSLMVTWWSSRADRLGTSQFDTFDSRGIVPIGYAVFAFALGVTAGVLLRRTLPAMAAALTAFAFARLAVFHWIRPDLITPVHQNLALNPATTGYGVEGFLLAGAGPSTLQPSPPIIPGAWITSIQIANNAGQRLTTQFLTRTCPGIGQGGPGGGSGGAGGSRQEAPPGAQQRLASCVAKVGRTFHEVASYQPASRYWPLQWLELVIYLGAAVALGGLCLWWVRRHLS